MTLTAIYIICFYTGKGIIAKILTLFTILLIFFVNLKLHELVQSNETTTNTMVILAITLCIRGQ